MMSYLPMFNVVNDNSFSTELREKKSLISKTKNCVLNTIDVNIF